eukprot:7822697-Ditylum_brightwellii.AAC.1
MMTRTEWNYEKNQVGQVQPNTKDSIGTSDLRVKSTSQHLWIEANQRTKSLIDTQEVSQEPPEYMMWIGMNQTMKNSGDHLVRYFSQQATHIKSSSDPAGETNSTMYIIRN